jgi:Mg-chelatase subunit ChlD
MAGDGAPRHVVYVLDVSGSMTSRIDRAEAELRRALDGLRPDETFNLVAFSDEVRSFDTGMAPATPALVRRASAYLDTLQVDGRTNLEGAMAKALSLPDVNEVILLTDGVPTNADGPYPKEEFPRIAREIARFNRQHARISAVGMVGKNPDGTDDSFEAAQLLQQIARDSGGACKIVTVGVASP